MQRRQGCNDPSIIGALVLALAAACSSRNDAATVEDTQTGPNVAPAGGPAPGASAMAQPGAEPWHQPVPRRVPGGLTRPSRTGRLCRVRQLVCRNSRAGLRASRLHGADVSRREGGRWPRSACRHRVPEPRRCAGEGQRDGARAAGNGAGELSLSEATCRDRSGQGRDRRQPHAGGPSPAHRA